jgi:hypothetical protein
MVMRDIAEKINDLYGPDKLRTESSIDQICSFIEIAVKEEIEKNYLRDEFAKASMIGLLNNNSYKGTEGQYAEYAYRFADAMIAERKKDANPL